LLLQKSLTGASSTSLPLQGVRLTSSFSGQSNARAVGSSTISSLINPPRKAARSPGALPKPDMTQSACFVRLNSDKSGPLAREMASMVVPHAKPTTISE
jgi:hypothetical protein